MIFDDLKKIERLESYETGSSLLYSLTEAIREFVTSISNNDDNNNNMQQSDIDLLQKVESVKVTPSTYIQHENKHPHSRTNEDKQRKQWHINAQRARYRHPKYAAMIMQRQRLPSFTYAAQICKAIRSNSVVIISGDTGCGKSKNKPISLTLVVGVDCSIPLPFFVLSNELTFPSHPGSTIYP